MDATPSTTPDPAAMVPGTNVQPPAAISRRTVLFGGFGLLAAPWVLAACGGSSTASSSSTSPTGGATTAPAGSAAVTSGASGTAKSGGVLRIARPPASTVETLDPASSL